jgi:hypothetical protein
VAGGEFGTVFQDQAIRRMSYIPGSALIFQIERITQDMGLYAPYSIIRAGSTIYFRAGQGFTRSSPAAFRFRSGASGLIARSSPISTRTCNCFRARPILAGTDLLGLQVGRGRNGLYDKILGYDTALDRFFPVHVSGEYLLGISQTGFTLENLDTISSSIDAL